MDYSQSKSISTTIPQLREQFDTCVPVVEIDGKIRFRGRVNRMLSAGDYLPGFS